MKDDSAPPSGGVGSSRWKELIEVASPISGRELDPTLPPLVPLSGKVTKGGLGCIFPRKERKSMTKHVSLE